MYRYRVSVPGSLMFMGEHAVLRGYAAIVLAIDRYLSVNLTPRMDSLVRIMSREFGEFTTELTRLEPQQPYLYLLHALQQFSSSMKTGCDLEIVSDFSSKLGLGSSAAVTVATLGVVARWLYGRQLERIDLYKRALRIVRLVQGIGSGADIAASIFGGILTYTSRPVKIVYLGDCLPICVIYSGTKISTTSVVAQVQQGYRSYPRVYQTIYMAMANCVQLAQRAILKNDWATLGKLMNIHHGLQDALGVNNSQLSQIVFALRETKEIKGAKISGAGLGDCVIGLGEYQQQTLGPGYQKIDVKVSSRGLSYLESDI